MSTLDDILAWMKSPEGQKQAAREARFVPVPVTEGLVGQFAEEFAFLVSKDSPWVKDCGEASEAALVKRLIRARECALRLTPDACRVMYTEKDPLAHQHPLTDEQLDRLHELNVLTEEHPISMNLDVSMLIVDPRLDVCEYSVADWLPGYIEAELVEWREQVDHPYGTPWVDSRLGAACKSGDLE